MNTGFGGFDNPLKRYSKKLFRHVVHRHLPNSRLPRAISLKSTRRNARAKPHPPLHTTWRHPTPGHEKDVNYISFDAVVGRNSKFVNLTSEQRDELGGVEYRVSGPSLGKLQRHIPLLTIMPSACKPYLQALRMLKRIVLSYILLVQLVPMAIFCPIFSTSKYAPVLQNGGVPASAGAWMVAFTVNAAYTK